MLGTKFGRYDIIEELGHGGMSVVYRGVDTGLERSIAIKVLHDHLAKKPENRQRLHREAKAIARLKHPNILEVFDFADEDAERAYIVMEYVEGENLRQFLDRTGPLPPEYGALLGIHLCRALAHAHEHGIIHRDLKPENIMVSNQGLLKLMDFGIAHIFDAETMTQTGSLLGSPAHMAPEMIEGEKVDERADIFALGTVLYWLVTGVLPFEGKNAPQILKRVLEGIFRNPEAVEPKVGQCFGDIIRKCLAYEIEDRYQDIGAVLTDLECFVKKVPFEDPTQALQTYIRKPEQTRTIFEETLVAQLLLCAEKALEAQAHTEAFRIYNRILAYEPHNARVHKAIQRIQRRQQGPRYALVAAILLLGSTGLYAIYKRVDIASSTANPVVNAPASTSGEFDRPEQDRAMERSRQLAMELASRRAALAAEDTQAAARLLASSRATIERLAAEQGQHILAIASDLGSDIASPIRPSLTQRNPIVALSNARANSALPDMGGLPDADMSAKVDQADRSHLYKFLLLPSRAILSIDGKEYEGAQANQGIELQEGKNYRLRAHCAPGCEPYITTLRVDGPQDPSRPRNITLAWRNGTVKIRSPRDSLLYLPGKNRRVVELQKGKEYHYVVKFGDAASSRKPQQELTFTIRDRNQMQLSYERTISVEPGSVEVVTAKF